MKNICKLSIIIITIFLTSCETDVTNDITLNDAAPKLVINGGLERNIVTPLSAQRIQLTTTGSFLSTDDLPVVEDASVTVADGTNSWIFSYNGNGFYENDQITPQIGNTYTITIVWNGETYEGSDTITEVPRFDDFYFEFEEETIATDEGYFVKFDTTDPAGIENFYHYRLFRNNEFIIVPDPGNSQVLIVSDEFFDGRQRIGVNPNDEVPFEVGDIATAQQLAISNDYFDFLNELFIQTGNLGNPIIGNPPPASIRGNLINLNNPNNRALGYFYAVDIEEDTITITED